jgi:hypothetical protein
MDSTKTKKNLTNNITRMYSIFAFAFPNIEDSIQVLANVTVLFVPLR